VIRHLTITDFKRFRALDLDLGALTVLTGKNSSGKSTVIQAFLLARLADMGAERGVPLNEVFDMRLGEAAEILHVDAEGTSFRLAIATQETDAAEYIFNVPADRSTYVELASRTGGSVPSIQGAGRMFTYLSAERLGPRDFIEASSARPEDVNVGSRGEYSGHLLALTERNEVIEALRHPDTTALGGLTTVRKQLELWLGEILEPVEVITQWVPGSEATLLRFKTPGVKADWVRPGNFGFGFSYLLPVILAALTATADGLLVVENPEGHLHPEGQSALGQFLGRVGAAGIQVVIETHSDHVVNGIRRAIVSGTAPDPPEVAIYYFDGTESGAQAHRLTVSPTGSLSAWPAGFFDQIELDLAEIAGAQLASSTRSR
jgi:predicted ATPase